MKPLCFPSLVTALLLLGAAATSAAADTDETLRALGEQALSRGVAFLVEAQGDDGGWHSETYGSMRQGAATSALVLYALGHAPSSQTEPHQKELDAAWSFLHEGIEKKGFVANPDGSLDFPTYGSAMALAAARRLKLDIPAEDRERLWRYLVREQLGERREFGEDSPHFGGWDLMGGTDLKGMTSGTNVSVSSVAVEALAAIDDDDARAAVARALRWTKGVQEAGSGGGFPFIPDPHSANNKAGTEEEDGGKPRSYGTTTCDGLLLLLAAGAKRDDPHASSAVQWLADHDGLKEVPGFADVEPKTGWEKGLLFYYYARLAAVLPHLPQEDAAARRRGMIRRLTRTQKDDGSWQNKSARMREDDPLIATSLAVIALSESLREE